MKKFIVSILVIGSWNVLANSYDYREKTETYCLSAADSELLVNITVQNETYMGWDGYAMKSISKANVNVSGKIDGSRVDIDESINIQTNTRDRLASAVEYSVGTKSKGITEMLLSTLTDDETTPGKNIKIVFKGQNVNLVHGRGVGFVSLNKGTEHYKTVPVNCSKKRDTADSGQEYMVKFQQI